jgi:hypothetical protein
LEFAARIGQAVLDHPTMKRVLAAAATPLRMAKALAIEQVQNARLQPTKKPASESPA